MANDFGIGALGVLLGAIVTGFFGWLTQRSKGSMDHSVAVLAEWSKLNKGLSDRLTEVEREFAAYRIEMAEQIESLRKHHADELEDMRKRHRAEMRVMRDLNEGLQRMIAQNSQSTAHLMGRNPMTDEEE